MGINLSSHGMNMIFSRLGLADPILLLKPELGNNDQKIKHYVLTVSLVDDADGNSIFEKNLDAVFVKYIYDLPCRPVLKT